MVKINEKKVKKPVRLENEAVENVYEEIKEEKREKSMLENGIDMVDKVIGENLKAGKGQYLSRDEVVCILNSLLK